MSDPILTISGQIRAVDPIRRKSDGLPFAQSVSVLTEAGKTLGDTAKVTVYNADWDLHQAIEPGSSITWAVAVRTNKYGANYIFREAIFPSTFHAFAGVDLEELTSSQADAAAMHADF